MREAAATTASREKAEPRKKHSKRRSSKRQQIMSSSTVSLLPVKPINDIIHKSVTELTIALIEQLNTSDGLIAATSTIPPIRRPSEPLALSSIRNADSTVRSNQPPASLDADPQSCVAASSLPAHSSEPIETSMTIMTSKFDEEIITTGPRYMSAAAPESTIILRPPTHDTKSIFRYPEIRLKEHFQMTPTLLKEESFKKSSIDSSGNTKKKKKPYRSAPKRKYSDDDMPATTKPHASARHDLPRSTSVSLLSAKSSLTLPPVTHSRAMSARQLTWMNSPKNSPPEGKVEASHQHQQHTTIITSSPMQTGDSPLTNGLVQKDMLLPMAAPTLVGTMEEHLRVDPAILALRERRRLRELACAKPPPSLPQDDDDNDDDDSWNSSSSSGSTSSSSSSSLSSGSPATSLTMEQVDPDVREQRVRRLLRDIKHTLPKSEDSMRLLEEHDGCDCQTSHASVGTKEQEVGRSSSCTKVAVFENHHKDQIKSNVESTDVASVIPAVVGLGEDSGDGLPEDDYLHVDVDNSAEVIPGYIPLAFRDKERSVSPEDSKENQQEVQEMSPRSVEQWKASDHDQHDIEDTYQVFQFPFVDPCGDTGLFTGSLSTLNRIPHGYGKMVYDKDARVYEGNWKRGQWDGHGKLVNGNGDMYEGEFLDNQRHGLGKYIWKSGREYVGEYVRDVRHGRGTFLFSDGSMYVGDFEHDAKHGFGRCDFPEGGYYEGEWKNNMFEGSGECYWPDGRSYRGEFSQNQSHGWGVEKFPCGQIRHDGLWNHDSPVK